MLASMSPTGAEVAAEEADTVAWPTGSETSGPVDSCGGGWELGELGIRQDLFTGGWERRRQEYDVTPLRSPQRAFCLRPHNCLPKFPPFLCFQMLHFLL